MRLHLIVPADLDALSRTAQANPRHRQHLNLHADYADPCQRLFNAVEPESYIRPHRHTDPLKPECFVAVRGRLQLLLFDDAGKVTERLDLAPAGPVVATDLAAGVWHTIIALEAGSIFFETKPGPYVALTDKDFAPWAPAEGSVMSRQYLATLSTTLLAAER
jgi:cupin fold WbuC family metalloprotein